MNVEENNRQTASSRQFFCCVNFVNFCRQQCTGKPCTDRCSYSCGFFNRHCGVMKCSDATPNCVGAPTPAPPPPTVQSKNLVGELKLQTGKIIEEGNQEYEQLRKVFNAACTAKPKVIVIPNSPQDVSHILRTATKFDVPISVRSGGHSYTCNSLKEGSIHIILKQFNRINLEQTGESETGYAAWLGTGAIWGDILRKIDPKVYSYPHGQCRSVGVGGFLLGGGVNWLGTMNKYGYGAENIIKMKAVLADGSIVMVDQDKTVYEDGRVVNHTPENNLFYGLRGAGTSMAIVLEFHYIIHKEPETRPAIVLVWLEDEAQVENLMKVMRSTDNYSFMLNQQISSLSFWERPILSPLMIAFPAAMQALRRINGKRSFPVQVMVTDIRLGAGRTTSPIAAVDYLKSQGVDVLLDSPANFLALRPLTAWAVDNSVTFAFDRIANVLYEEIEKEQESWQPGVWSSISLNYGSLTSTSSFAKDFLDDPFVGSRRSIYLSMLTKSCEFCFWMVHFRNRQRQTGLAQETPVSIRSDLHQEHSAEINLTCMFKPGQDTCTQVVNDVRSRIESRLGGTSYSKYVNFPSCSSKSGSDWKSLYWGDNVSKLLTIKNSWDPKDMFNHCLSLTNADPTCCPYSA